MCSIVAEHYIPSTDLFEKFKNTIILRLKGGELENELTHIKNLVKQDKIQIIQAIEAIMDYMVTGSLVGFITQMEKHIQEALLKKQ